MSDDQPLLCVFRADNLTAWIVALCRGRGHARQVLARFATRQQAIGFAAAERQRRQQANEPAAELFLPEECACIPAHAGTPHAA
jgi:hypothetical protein